MAYGCVIPEVAVSVTAALAGEQDITIGNVIEDNMLTLTLVFGFVGLTFTFSVSLSEILLTAPFMVVVTLMLFTLNKLGQNITRPGGIVMLTTACFAFIFPASSFMVWSNKDEVDSVNPKTGSLLKTS